MHKHRNIRQVFSRHLHAIVSPKFDQFFTLRMRTFFRVIFFKFQVSYNVYSPCISQVAMTHNISHFLEFPEHNLEIGKS